MSPDIHELVEKIMETYGASEYIIIKYDPDSSAKITFTTSKADNEDFKDYLNKLLNDVWDTYSKSLPVVQLMEIMDTVAISIATKYGFHFLRLYNGHQSAWLFYKLPAK